MMRVLDLFSAAAGGWSLGLQRAGFTIVAACEIVEWRRILYSENFPHVRLYEDVRDLTAARLVSDLGFLPDVIVGSPPCQDISGANAKGAGIDGERSGLYLEATRIIAECRPRWIALENSAYLRTRGADRVLGELEAHGYTCHACVVAAADVGANHERKRSWIVGFDPEQLIGIRIPIPPEWLAIRDEIERPSPHSHADAARVGHAGGRSRRHRPDGHGSASSGAGEGIEPAPHAAAVGSRQGDRHAAAAPWSDWNGGLARHLRLDDGLSARLADTRLVFGGSRGTAANNLIVEAFGDAVLPQIPEAIGRAMLRTELALASLFGTLSIGIRNDDREDSASAAAHPAVGRTAP